MMNDDELTTTVRESVADVYSATPVARIIDRGRAVRARRRIPGVAGALAVAAGAAVAVTTVLLPGHPDSHPAGARLAAWTVTRQANGDIDVTISQLENPAGLQSTLRADGVPAHVNFAKVGPKVPCYIYDNSQDVVSAVFHFTNGGGGTHLVINPSALPSGTGVSIHASVSTHARLQTGSPSPGLRSLARGTYPVGGGGELFVLGGGVNGAVSVDVVYASPQCTG
jgi:hypothetical protein